MCLHNYSENLAKIFVLWVFRELNDNYLMLLISKLSERHALVWEFISTLQIKPYTYMYIYHKRQQLSERKVSRFAGFNPNVGKTFTVYTLIVKKAIAQLKICWENFCGSSKICKNHEIFLSLNFCYYAIIKSNS